VRVGANNIVEWDPEIERVKLSSGKPLVCVLFRAVVSITVQHLLSIFKLITDEMLQLL
jgi:hypothetical protein